MTVDMFFPSFAIIIISFLTALILTGSVKRVLLRRSVLDMPNDRSSHQTPVPRGGGWGMLMVLLPGLIGAAIFIDGDARHAGLIAAIFLLASISWLDDRQGLSARVRLSIHLLAACLGSLCFTPHELIFAGALPFWLDRTLMIMGWAWFINLYNFMDGIDGISGTETISIAMGLCIIATATGIDHPFINFLTLMLIGVCLGFLAYNWHPASIFLGDVGSVPLGYLIGFCLISLALQGYLVAALILPLYYLADSGITLTRRALRREKIWQAHRQHFYQRAAYSTQRHDPVVLWVASANIGLIGAALISLSYPLPGLSAAIVIVAILLGNMHKTALKHRTST